MTKKYGQDFAAAADRNVDGCVNERVIHRLSVQPPNAYLVVNYMKEIAKQHNVNWTPDEAQVIDPLAPMVAPTGATVPNATASGPDFAAIYAQAPLGAPPSALPTIPTADPNESFPSADSLPPAAPVEEEEKAAAILTTESPSANIPDFDELSARFENLRRRAS